jgi:hypothetical protein
MSKKIIAIDLESFKKLKLFKSKYKTEKGRNITYGEIMARILANADYDKSIN